MHRRFPGRALPLTGRTGAVDPHLGHIASLIVHGLLLHAPVPERKDGRGPLTSSTCWISTRRPARHGPTPDGVGRTQPRSVLRRPAVRAFRDCGLDFDLWYPLPRRLLATAKFVRNHRREREHLRHPDTVHERFGVRCGPLRRRSKRRLMTTGGRLEYYRRGDLTFEVIDIGPADGTPVVFLHGFPIQFLVGARSWSSWTRLGLPLPGTQPAGGYPPGSRRRVDATVCVVEGSWPMSLPSSTRSAQSSSRRPRLGRHGCLGDGRSGSPSVSPLTTLSVPHPAASSKASNQQADTRLLVHVLLPAARGPGWFYSRAGGKHGLVPRWYAGQSPDAAHRDVARILKPIHCEQR